MPLDPSYSDYAQSLIDDIRDEVRHLGLQTGESLAEFIRRLHALVPAKDKPQTTPETPPAPPPQA